MEPSSWGHAYTNVSGARAQAEIVNPGGEPTPAAHLEHLVDAVGPKHRDEGESILLRPTDQSAPLAPLGVLPVHLHAVRSESRENNKQNEWGHRNGPASTRLENSGA